MLATSSKNKGNVIPGVAIATALMPLCVLQVMDWLLYNFNFFWCLLFVYN
jgi:hypothetical protein